jgi:hypothetical protein
MSDFQEGLPDLRDEPRRRPAKPKGPAKVVEFPKLLCPACLRPRIKLNRTEPIEPGDTVRQRWHLCESCGWHFQSLETLHF